MHTRNKHIGIWGLGAVGQSALVWLLAQKKYAISVCSAKKPDTATQKLLDTHAIPFFSDPDDLPTFLTTQDRILPSPGIDLRPYQQYAHKWIAEVDIIQEQYHGSTVAVTGTTGKTSIVTLLSQIVQQSGCPMHVGGNIGYPMLNLLSEKKRKQRPALLEVSSFQLEHATRYAPDLAIWTNFHPNHLDRHETNDDYFAAKARLITQQTKNQKALIPYAIFDRLSRIPHGAGSWYVFSPEPLDCPTRTTLLRSISGLFYLDGQKIVYHTRTGTKTIAHLSEQQRAITFAYNWLIIIAALQLLGIPYNNHTAPTALSLPEHRLEYVGTYNGVTIINDSKATTPDATLAAVQQYTTQPVRLVLGGLDKGIDRQPLIAALSKKVVKIYCFGAQAKQLDTYCMHHAIDHERFATLAPACHTALEQAQPGDVILFSPAGASFDLFANYQERGAYFKRLIASIQDPR